MAITAGEVINIDKQSKKNQKDDYGNTLPLGSIKVRMFSNLPYGDPVDVWASPAWHNNLSPPLKGEHVFLLKGPSYLRSTPYSGAGLNNEYYYLPTPINTSDDLVFNQLPNSTHRTIKGQSPKVVKPGKYLPFPPKPQPILQIYEGDVVLKGRQGSTLRFGQTLDKGRMSPWVDKLPTWEKGGEYGDPITIFKVSKPGPKKLPPHFSSAGGASAGSGNYGKPIVITPGQPGKHQAYKKNNTQVFDIEDLSQDNASLYLTTTQKLAKLTPARLCTSVETKMPKFKEPQGVFDADRMVINAKGDKTIILGKKGVHLNGKKIRLITDEHDVDFDKFVNVVQDLSRELAKLTSAREQFFTVPGLFNGPTLIATNVITCARIFARAWSLNKACKRSAKTPKPSQKEFKLGQDTVTLKSTSTLDIPKLGGSCSGCDSAASIGATGGGGGGGGSSSGGGGGGSSSGGGGGGSGSMDPMVSGSLEAPSYQVIDSFDTKAGTCTGVVYNVKTQANNGIVLTDVNQKVLLIYKGSDKKDLKKGCLNGYYILNNNTNYQKLNSVEITLNKDLLTRDIHVSDNTLAQLIVTATVGEDFLATQIPTFDIIKTEIKVKIL